MFVLLISEYKNNLILEAKARGVLRRLFNLLVVFELFRGDCLNLMKRFLGLVLVFFGTIISRHRFYLRNGMDV